MSPAPPLPSQQQESLVSSSASSTTTNFFYGLAHHYETLSITATEALRLERLIRHEIDSFAAATSSPLLLNLRVVPAGVTDASTWPAFRSIPSNKVTIHISLKEPKQVPEISGNQIHIHLIKKPPRWDKEKEKDDEETMVMMLDIDMAISTSYDVNIGPGAAGVYALDVTSIVEPPQLLGLTTFMIEPSHPLARWDDDGGGPCRDLHSVGEEDGSISPFVNIPADLCERYTMGGLVGIGRDYYDDRSDPDKSYVERSSQEIESLIESAKRRETYYYGRTDEFLYAALDRYPITNKRVLLIGSNVPWYESICVAFVAAECITVDYNKLRYHHPSLKTYTPSDLQALPAKEKLFDVVWSISSFEHDGLGRYGDPLNPDGDLEAIKCASIPSATGRLAHFTNLPTYLFHLPRYGDPLNPDGDLEAMQSVHQYLQPMAGLLMLAVPVGQDRLYWNSNRIYGKLRLPRLLDGWEMIESFGFRQDDYEWGHAGDHQPVFVLQSKGANEAKQPAAVVHT